MKKFLLSTTMMMASIAMFAQTARVQIIHNCPDAVADSVDVYLDGTLLQDNVAFRTATPFIDAPAATPITLGVAPKNSMSVTDTIYSLTATLDSTKTYIIVANGIVSMSGYTPAPAFRLSIFDMGREAASMSSNTDVLVMHGSTDAPTVDVRNNADNSVLVDDAMFGDFSADYLELPTSDYVLNITDASGMTSVAKYSAPLQTLNLAGGALVVLASGFLNPSNNSNGPAFGLYAATAAGGALVQLPTFTSINNVASNDLSFSVWPSPAVDVLNINGKFDNEVNVTIYNVTGKRVMEQNGFSGNSLDVSSLTSGIYFIRVNHDGQVGTQRFIKN